MLTPDELQRFRERLEAEGAAIRRRLEARGQDLKTTARETDTVADAGDQSVRLYDREEDIEVDQLDRENLDQIERALARIEAGTYGVSEVSGKPIPIERLEAVPWSTTLVGEPDPREP